MLKKAKKSLTIKRLSKKKEKEQVQRTRELKTVYEIGVLINDRLGNLDVVFPFILEKVASLTGYEMGAIFLLNEAREVLEMKSQIGHSPAMLQEVKVLKFNEGVSGETIRLKEPVIVSIREYPSPRIARILRKEGVQTVVGIPLLGKGKAVGAIILSTRSPRQLSRGEVDSLGSVGNHIGIALENAELLSTITKAKSEWETTFDAVTDLITILDKDYRMIRANKATFVRFELKPKEMIGRKCFEILSRGDQPCEECPVSETLKTKGRAWSERNCKYLSGVFKHETFPIFDSEGEVVAVVDLSREITEEKRFEIEKEVINNINKILASSLDVREVFRAVHSELKKVLNTDRMTIVIFDEDKEGFQFFALDKNYEIKELMEGVTYPLKGTPSEKAAQTGLPVIISNTEESDYWSSQKLLKEGIHSILVFPLEYKEKIFGTLNFGCEAVNHFSERHLNILQQIAPGLAISIQNAMLLDEIKRSEEKYRTVVESAIDGVCVIGRDYLFKYVNERLAEIHGYRGEQLIGADFRNLLDEESRALLADREDKRARGIKLPPHFELNFLHKGGGGRNAEISARAIKDSKGDVNIIAFVRDITERKQAEETLRRSEETSRLLSQENAVMAEIGRIISSTLNIEEVYPRFADEVRKIISFDRISVNTLNPDRTSITIPYAFGVKVEDVPVGTILPLHDLFIGKVISRRQGLLILMESESELAKSYPSLLKHFQTGFRSMMSVPLISKDQVIGILHLNSLKPKAYTEPDVRLLERVGNQIAGAIANAHLFNERKRAEEALRQSEEKYRTILETMQDAYYEVDLAGYYTFVNDALCRNFGYTKEELIGMKSLQHQDEAKAKKTYDSFKEIYRTGEPVKALEVEYTRKDGTKGTYELSASLIRDAQGKPIGLRGISRDITERKKAEEALRQSEEKYRTILENIQEGYFEDDLSGNLTFFNDTLCKHLGYTREELMGMNYRQRVDGKDAGKLRHAYSELYRTGEPIKALEAEFVRKNGTKLIGEFSSSLIRDSAGKPIGFRGISRDITERKQAEVALRQSEEEARRLSQENAVIAEIGRIISSTLDINEVYERFAEEVSKFIPFDRIALTTINPDQHSGTMAYVLGVEVKDRNQGNVLPLVGSFYEEIFSKRSGILVQTEDESELAERYPILLSTFRAGLRSMISVPLISKGQVIGVLHIRSLKPNAYTELDLKLAERVGNQIAGAIASAQLFSERLHAEEALQKSEEEAKRLAQENATMAEIGRIVSSTLDINEVYERFAEKARKLIPFDRIMINLTDLKNNATTTAYITGVDVPDQWPGNITSLTGTATEEAALTRSTLLIQGDNIDEAASRFPRLLSTFQAGIRSVIFVPLISKDQVIGVLSFRSLVPKAYTDQDVRLAESIGNQIAGAIASAQLFTERKQAEVALRQSEERYRNILESIEDGYYEVDLAGNLTFFNDALRRIYGYPKEEVTGMNYRRFTDQENAKKLFQTYNKVYRTGEPGKVFDWEIIRKDGTRRHVEASVSLQKDTSGKAIGFRGILRDVTEKKKAEDQLLQSEKLRAVGEMASGVAHDFNNALAAILGNTQLLLHTAQDEELKETLKIIEKVAKDSGQTVRRLQDFTRKRVDQELFKVDVNAIIRDSMEMTKPKWKDEPQSRGVRIEMVSNLEEIPSVSGNASELREVITNMIFNAIEAMHEGGKVEIHTSQKGKNVLIRVADTGIGISGETKKRIFEPFFTTKPFTHTGLGLSMSYGIIKRFGGEIEIESEVGKGTAFTIILPIGGEEEEEPVFPQAIPKGRQALILVIDDDEFVRSVLSRTLAQANHQVTLAENGEKGVQIFKEGKFDMVLTDLGLPGMSGWEVCRMIKEISPHTPVGMITGWGMEKDRNKVEEVGLDFLISKPFDFNQILNVVSKAVASEER